MALSSNPKDLVNLRKQLAFYGAYHTDPINVAIHIVGVPTIIFGAHCLLGSAGPVNVPSFLEPVVQPILATLQSVAPEPLTRYAQLNWSALFAMSYWCYYAVLDHVAATMMLPIWAGLYYASQYVQYNGNATKAGLIAQAIGWVSQFYGHGVHEGRAPALLDNLLGAVVLAPFFVWLEVLFSFGYRPALHKELKNETGKLVVEFRKGDAAKRAAKKAKAV